MQGLPLSVNGLVHIPGFGDYQMSRIEKPEDPFPLGPEKVTSGTDIQMSGSTVLAVANPEKQVHPQDYTNILYLIFHVF